MKIINLSAYKILASMGNETVEAKLIFDNGQASMASVPAGISAGKYEVKKSLPDQAIREIGEIRERIIGREWTQETLDREISNHNFGGNATLAVSAAFFKASHQNLATSHFPKLMLLLFEGAKHGNPNIKFQEFMIIEDSVEQARADFEQMRSHVLEQTVGAEGGFSPESFNNEKILELIVQVFPDKRIAIDMAGSFGHDFKVPEGIFSVEDPFDDESWDKWTQFLAQNPKLQVVGDDLTVTNPQRIKKAIDLKAINAVIIKPNQNGTISGAMEAVKAARDGGLKIVVSHRGEETDDDWIVDFALAARADYVKFGGMDRGERVAKYNRLLALQNSQSPGPTNS
ncbi:MAG: hypothetical protein M1484_01940 [Patescibacteria group bacterium]|nr:hypothetical protein [Patescibacteria group bacterium]